MMLTEIGEQPAVWRAGLERRADVVGVARAIQARGPRFVLLAARGTSDHAALYAKYLVEVLLGWPAGLVSPSTITAYGARPALGDVLVIGVSQSGGSPDLVQTMEVARAGGALTLAVTNAAGSALARAAELHLDVGAGAERAVAATKSYTAQLLALFLLVDALRGGDGAAAEGLPEWGETVLGRAAGLGSQAVRYRFAERMVVTGRGYAYPTAREAALKLMETSYVAAQAFSGADLLHGPLAMLDAGVPVLAVAPRGVAGAAMGAVLPRVRAAGAEVFLVGDPALGADFALPDGVAEEVSPLLEILPFQHLALHLALARGENPDAPRGLQKVTETL